MNTNDSETSGEEPFDQNQEWEEHPLECIGSFKAYTPEGECHTVEIWTHFQSVHDRQRARVEPGMLILKTSEGRPVERLDQGDYRLLDNPEVPLTSTDEHAP